MYAAVIRRRPPVGRRGRITVAVAGRERDEARAVEGDSSREWWEIGRERGGGAPLALSAAEAAGEREGVVLEAREADEGGVDRSGRADDVADEVLPRADADDRVGIESAHVGAGEGAGWRMTAGTSAAGKRGSRSSSRARTRRSRSPAHTTTLRTHEASWSHANERRVAAASSASAAGGGYDLSPGTCAPRGRAPRGPAGPGHDPSPGRFEAPIRGFIAWR